MYAGLINTIIAILHRLMYEYNDPGNLSYYEIRTRKIISYSNLIATTSNVLIVGIITGIGVAKTMLDVGDPMENAKLIKKALSYGDIGGLLVTLHRLVTDSIFISEIKQEFLEKEFYKIVMGDDFNF
jgi:hypothetical protein